MNDDNLPALRDAAIVWAISMLILFVSGSLPLSERFVKLFLPQAAILVFSLFLLARQGNVRHLFRWLDGSHLPMLAGLVVAGVLSSQGAAFLTEHFASPPKSYREYLRILLPSDMLELIILLGMTWFLVAPAEETLFRGVIYRRLRQALRPPHAMALSSLMFAASHLDPWRFAPTLMVGVFSTLALEKTDSLISSFVLHAANNSVVLVLSLHGLAL